jgi:hypothetical protein
MASEGQIVDGFSYDAEALMKYSKPKINNSGGKNVNILNAKSNKATTISTPLLLTWGVNEWPAENGGNTKYDFQLQFPGEEYATPNATRFLENMKAFEEKLKADAVENSREWFGKTSMSREVVDALFTPMLRYPKNKETGEFDTSRSPTLRVKIPYWDGAFDVEIYDLENRLVFPDEENNHVMPGTLIQKGSNVATIIKNGGIWFANGKFGTTWKLVQCMVKPKATLKGRCHISLDDDEKEKAARQVVNDDEATENPNVNMTTNVNDSDDDDKAESDKEEETEKPETPPPAAKKKRVVKKKKAAADSDDE